MGDTKEAMEEVMPEPCSDEEYWPVIDPHHRPPARRYHFHGQFQQAETIVPNNFFKGTKWAPDGSCFFTCSDDNSLRVFDLPCDVVPQTCQELTDADSCQDSFNAAVRVQEGETLYDFCWYPCMSAADPGSCLIATTTRDHPVHLWDAVTGDLRCTYRAYDAMDEIAAAYSVSFNPSGSKVFCGYNKTIRVFDAARPGREYVEYSTLNKTKDGQTGIISCLAFNPDRSGLLAAGSYSRTTALYAEDNAELLFVLHGQEGGVTQVQFSKDGNFLYTGARKDPNIMCWDVRHTAGVVYKLPRVTASTNQRIAFDIERSGRYLGTGGQDGYVHLYDLMTGDWVSSYQAAVDTVNGFAFHPTLPLAATSSGHRRFPADMLEDGNQTSRLLTPFENCASVWCFEWVWQSMASQGPEVGQTTASANGDHEKFDGTGEGPHMLPKQEGGLDERSIEGTSTCSRGDWMQDGPANGDTILLEAGVEVIKWEQ